MLLRDYYSSLTYSSIGNSNVTEDVAHDLSPRYSRSISGNYILNPLGNSYVGDILPSDIGREPTFDYGAKDYVGGTSSSKYARRIWFGSNTTSPTFNDYAPTGEHIVSLGSTRTSYQTSYDETTHTYTSVETFTLTNNSNYILEVNEILMGATTSIDYSGNNRGSCAYTRDLLGENSFSIGAKESVKFELTIKYTIAEPLK